jgi:hypothetical protein
MIQILNPVQIKYHLINKNFKNTKKKVKNVVESASLSKSLEISIKKTK